MSLSGDSKVASKPPLEKELIAEMWIYMEPICCLAFTSAITTYMRCHSWASRWCWWFMAATPCLMHWQKGVFCCAVSVGSSPRETCGLYAPLRTNPRCSPDGYCETPKPGSFKTHGPGSWRHNGGGSGRDSSTALACRNISSADVGGFTLNHSTNSDAHPRNLRTSVPRFLDRWVGIALLHREQ